MKKAVAVLVASRRACRYRFGMDRPNLRAWRAQRLARAVVEKIRPNLADGEEASVLAELTQVFSDLGVEVLTDEDRAEYGLPPRGPDGWTEEEIKAIEQRRRAALGMPSVPGKPC
jgi:DUF1009 family protein